MQTSQETFREVKNQDGVSLSCNFFIKFSTKVFLMVFQSDPTNNSLLTGVLLINVIIIMQVMSTKVTMIPGATPTPGISYMESNPGPTYQAH